jgi:hypothetical protein
MTLQFDSEELYHQAMSSVLALHCGHQEGYTDLDRIVHGSGNFNVTHTWLMAMSVHRCWAGETDVVCISVEIHRIPVALVVCLVGCNLYLSGFNELVAMLSTRCSKRGAHEALWSATRTDKLDPQFQ